MGKIILIVIGALAAWYTAAAVVQMVYRFLTTDPTNAIGIADMAASVVPAVIGLAISIVCFRAGLAKPRSDDKSEGDSSGD